MRHTKVRHTTELPTLICSRCFSTKMRVRGGYVAIDGTYINLDLVCSECNNRRDSYVIDLKRNERNGKL